MSSSPKTNIMTAPRVRVSWGELIDRLTILEIKARRLQSENATANVRRLLSELERVAREAFFEEPELVGLKQRLKSVNQTLWDIEDKIRAKEVLKSFDQEFIQLARSVYINNDKRAILKRQIDMLLNSELTDEKQYTRYLISEDQKK